MLNISAQNYNLFPNPVKSKNSILYCSPLYSQQIRSSMFEVGRSKLVFFLPFFLLVRKPRLSRRSLWRSRINNKTLFLGIDLFLRPLLRGVPKEPLFMCLKGVLPKAVFWIEFSFLVTFVGLDRFNLIFAHTQCRRSIIGVRLGQ